MELRTVNGRLNPGAAFRLIATGYVIGACAIFGPLFLLATVLMSFQSPRFLIGLVQLLLLPIIVGIQSVVLGGVIVLGLWLYQKRKPILVVDDSAASD